MPLLSDLAIISDIFETNKHDSPELADVRIQYLKEVLLSEALIRDLRGNQWITNPSSTNLTLFDKRAKELLIKLIKQKRIIKTKPVLEQPPNTCIEWCEEALASHRENPLDGIITMKETVNNFSNHSDRKWIASFEQLSNADWWQSKSSSIRLNRTTSEYIKNLALILNNANSLMFIDPYLDPTLERYKEFIELLRIAANRKPIPAIEIHRGSSKMLHTDDLNDLEALFKEGLNEFITNIGLKVKVFIWDNFHDRYLITDLIGISIPNGFDVNNKKADLTTWCRLGRKDRDDVQREFDKGSNRHRLQKSFMIP